MAISRKPHRSPAPAVDVDALINRGGSPTGAQDTGTETKAIPVLVRVPANMVEQIDSALKGRPIRLPRHTWILEAIHEKLNRELQPKV
jgi:hypothetical protein